MRTMKIGGSGVECSVLGLGCMGMSEFYGEVDDEASLRCWSAPSNWASAEII